MNQSCNQGPTEDFGRWWELLAGIWVWIFHKFTGWVLVGYLFTHIAALSTTLSGTTVYIGTIQVLESLLVVRILGVELFAVAIFYILNGLQPPFIDLGAGLEAQDKSFYASLILTGVIIVMNVLTFLSGVST